MNFDWRELGAFLGVIVVANGLMLWAVKLLLQRQSETLANKLNELTTSDETQTDAINALQRDLNKHKLESARNYLHREDAVIWFGRFEQKIDALWNFLHDRFESKN